MFKRFLATPAPTTPTPPCEEKMVDANNLDDVVITASSSALSTTPLDAFTTGWVPDDSSTDSDVSNV